MIRAIGVLEGIALVTLHIYIYIYIYICICLYIYIYIYIDVWVGVGRAGAGAAPRPAECSAPPCGSNSAPEDLRSTLTDFPKRVVHNLSNCKLASESTFEITISEQYLGHRLGLQLTSSGGARPLSEFRTNKTVKARLWPWLEPFSVQTF